VTWKCNAITNGITIFPSGKIGPCCQIAADYLKPIEQISDPGRFDDLLTEHPPLACSTCISAEDKNLPSYREFFNSRNVTDSSKIMFLDIRNTNQCNLKCRYCGPHFSNQWAKELEIKNPLKHFSLDQYLDQLISEELKDLYFTGGEPFISADHWKLIQLLVDRDLAKNIDLRYNTNLTVLTYKNLHIKELWSKFKSVQLMVSFESVEKLFENIRSNASWKEFKSNLDDLLTYKVKITAAAVLSILNIWDLTSFVEFCINKKLKIDFIMLTGPDYLALDVIPDEFKHLALDQLAKSEEMLGAEYRIFFNAAREKVSNNLNQCLINHTINHVLLLDKLRHENMFDCLPFKSFSKNLILNNSEYE
jgi:molybdenum cofactor biosynthesis enzyme MoaA